MPSGHYERTAEHGRRISEGLKGKRPKNLDELHRRRKGSRCPQVAGQNNAGWKGDAVGYHALHAWVRRWLGAPRKCSACGDEAARRYEWANISGEYRRDLSDWRRLCASCHRKEAYLRGENSPLNEGKRVQSNTGRTHIRPGQHISPATEFRPGITPANKYLKPRTCATCGKEFQPRDAKRKYCSRPCYWEAMRRP